MITYTYEGRLIDIAKTYASWKKSLRNGSSVMHDGKKCRVTSMSVDVPKVNMDGDNIMVRIDVVFEEVV